MQINGLFDFMKQTLPCNDMMSFTIFENLYSALEELAGTFPKEFNGDFLKLAFRCLPTGFDSIH